ncbi:Cytochrome c oxidase subunit 7A [Neurospora sp. IMI 360204]|nr:Cytochrome c oxidase subunit 7A [Neurospora sp. IMI 360204]
MAATTVRPITGMLRRGLMLDLGLSLGEFGIPMNGGGFFERPRREAGHGDGKSRAQLQPAGGP